MLFGALALLVVAAGRAAADGMVDDPSSSPRLVVQIAPSPFASAVFTPDGGLAWTVDVDGSARLWDLQTGKLVSSLQVEPGWHTVAITPDCRHALTAFDNRSVRVWDLETGKATRFLEGEPILVRSVAFAPDGRHALISDKGTSSRLWDLETGRVIRTLETGPKFVGTIDCVAIAPDGRHALSGGSDGAARLWDLQTGKTIRTLEGHGKSINSVAVAPDGRQALTGSWDRTAKLWDLQTGKTIRTLEGHGDAVNAVAITRDGRRGLTGSRDKTARLWDLETGRLIHTLKGQSESVEAVALAPDGRRALTVRWNATARLLDLARLWDLETGKSILSLEGHGVLVSALAITPNGRYVLTASGQEKTARLWDLEKGRTSHTLEGHSKPIYSIAIAPDGRLALTGSYDKTVRLWDLETGKPVRTLEGHRGVVLAGAIAPDNRHALTACGDKAWWWDLTTGTLVRSLGGHENLVLAVAIAPDGRRAITGSGDNKLRLWDLETGNLIRTFAEHTQPVLTVAIAPDGRRAISGSDDKTARLWDLETGKLVRILEGHGESVISAAFAPDGRYALTGSHDREARLYNLETGQWVRSLQGHGDSITAVAMTPDGRHALTGSTDATTRLWNLGAGRELCKMLSFDDGAWAVVDSSGRVDSDHLEVIRGFQWVFPDDPNRPLAPEIFLRDYYEPRLLPRTLAGETFKPVRALSRLNRVQPGVRIAGVTPGGEPGIARVTVEVAAAEGRFGRADGGRLIRTEVYDARLFRDGHFVARWPELQDESARDPDSTSEQQMDSWRDDNRIKLGPDGRATRTFTVRLPHRDKAGPVEFTAYAFNEDRVKSETATHTYDAPANPPSVRPRAYLICIGVSASQSRRWDLAFPAADARRMREGLGGALERAGRYDVVPVLLTSERGDDGSVGTATATKANIDAVLDLLAGRAVDEQVEGRLPGADRILRATPDDLVVLSFSGHGYIDARGSLYLLPYDVGVDKHRVEDILPRCISTAELSAWLRGVDAGELAMVVDACHSAAAVQQPGFKPGPLGARGLGQLAYDKGMRVLTASQADDVAVESYKIRHGLLTYALVKDGLEQRRAARDGVVTLGGLLSYAAERVPALYREVLAGEVKDADGTAARNVGAVRSTQGQSSAVQKPELFDYDRDNIEVVLSGADVGR